MPSQSMSGRLEVRMRRACKNPANYRAGERGLSDFDQRHILRINGVWELPRLEGRGWIRHAVGSWRLAGIVSRLSGQPFTVTSGRDMVLVGVSRGLAAQRADVIGAGRLDPDRSRSELIKKYFNTDAFVLPALGSFGNNGRNSLFGPGSFNIDQAVLKRLSPWTSDRKGVFEFRGEVFNLLNYVNLGNPTSNMNSTVYGQITSARDARIFQFGLRYEF
jgi:hypothetical protein